jgi:alkane 1-monooxygenase
VTQNFYLKTLGFSLCLSIPLLPIVGYIFGTTWLTPIMVFVVFPIAGLIIGSDKSAAPAGIERMPWLTGYLYILPLVFVPLWIANLAWGANLLATNKFSGWEIAGMLFSLAISSAFATCVAHELQHRTDEFDRATARIMMAICGYGHLLLEHLHHHATVGDSEIGGTPRKGEASYHFVLRNVAQGAQNAWQIEQRRLQARNGAWWHNRIVQDYALAVGVAASFVAVWGRWGVAVFAAQALFAVFAIEMITYIQHYGILRAEGESIGAQHAWAHNCWLTNGITLNITHHSDHHMNVSKPYYELRFDPNAPHLPACYFVMFIAALFPPVWRWMMDRQISNDMPDQSVESPAPLQMPSRKSIEVLR